jgi:putative ABC transport system permease protein
MYNAVCLSGGRSIAGSRKHAMKFLPLLWSGIWRKPVRTALIFLQVTVAFALFGVLQGMKTGVDEAVAKTRADLLFVGPSAQGGAPLPLAYMDRLRTIKGVKTVTFADGLLGSYQKPTQPVFVLALAKSDVWPNLAPEIFTVTPQDLEALQRTRDGALINADIGRKYGWRIGDRIPLMSGTLQSNGSGTWGFEIVGLFTDHEPGEANFIVGNYDYLDDARALDKGTARNFYVVVADPKQATTVSDAIDSTFANSPIGTRTATFRENAQQQMQSLGDLNFAIRSIVSAVLVAIVFSTATMMMQGVRERTPELAVLKALGFGNRLVFCLVGAEALLVCIAASLVGLALAWIAFPLAAKYVPGLSLPLVVVGLGVVGAVFVALISVSVPGMRAARLQVVDGLAGR